ncbi:MAG: exopolyphosphatase, partial [Acidobacteriaceae bacterium]|nr:exopolyphosphatase [Acidobacteriaceae bacterium]
MPRYAAIDVGSNSLRMLAADVSHGITTVLAQDRQVTRLGESVFRTGRISDDAMDFLVATLSRMASVYSRLNILGVRAVATSAVRDASNQQEFLQRAGEALGTHVEIISGAEEARLIHLGVEARWPRPGERTLIIDVGGGSAELIISQNGELIDSVSKPLGAVRLTEIFLKNDPPGPEDLRHMNSFITEKLHSFYEAHAGEKFDRAIGTSASAAAVVCAVNQIPRAERDEAD